MLNYLYIALGSAIGGVFRYWCINGASYVLGTAFPWGTMIVNVVGSLVIGIGAGLVGSKANFSPQLQSFMMVGICGGYTTFSTFSLDSFKLLQKAEILKATLNMGLSFVLCLAAVSAGYFLVGYVNRI